LTNQLGLALGIGGVTSGLRLALELTLAAGAIAACVALLVRRRRDYEHQEWLVAAGAVSLLLLLTLTWVMPWYVFWVIPLAALVRGQALRIGVLVVGVTLLMTWLPLSQQFFHD